MPAPTKSKSMYVRVRPDVHAAMARLAAKTGLSFGDVLDQIVRDYLHLPYPQGGRVADAIRDEESSAA